MLTELWWEWGLVQVATAGAFFLAASDSASAGIDFRGSSSVVYVLFLAAPDSAPASIELRGAVWAFFLTAPDSTSAGFELREH